VERRIAVAAKFSSGSGGTQPVATGQALRIDTLHGPSRQILHVSPPLYSGGLQVEPAPDSGGFNASLETFSVKVEPAPDSGGLHASLKALRVHPCGGEGLRINVQRKSKARTRWNDARPFPLWPPGPETKRKSCGDSASMHLWCQEERYNP
jgi:hypothetical protein